MFSYVYKMRTIYWYLVFTTSGRYYTMESCKRCGFCEKLEIPHGGKQRTPAGWNHTCQIKVKVHPTIDIAPLRSETPPQKRSGMAHVLNGFHSFTCTPTRSSTIGMSHTWLCLPSRSWNSFTDPGGMEG